MSSICCFRRIGGKLRESFLLETVFVSRMRFARGLIVRTQVVNQGRH